MLDPTLLRRTAAVLALLVLPACGPTDKAGAGPPTDGAATASPTSTDTATTNSPSPSESASSDHAGKPSTDKPNPPPAAAAGLCRSSDLHISTGHSGGSGAGHIVIQLVFQNTSSHACWVRGYPGVSYVAGSDGHQVGGSAVRDSAHGPGSPRIWLIPNAHAYASLNQSQPDNYPAGSCRPTSVRGLRIYPPEETASIYVPSAGRACANGNTSRPLITALSKTPQ